MSLPKDMLYSVISFNGALLYIPFTSDFGKVGNAVMGETLAAKLGGRYLFTEDSDPPEYLSESSDIPE